MCFRSFMGLCRCVAAQNPGDEDARKAFEFLNQAHRMLKDPHSRVRSNKRSVRHESPAPVASEA